MDELEWLVDNGCHLFMFNESDLGGMPERVMEICDEIIHRGLHRKVKLTGQLRVNKKQNKAFFEKLREANFVALRFGVDAFSENTLRLQMKGYTVEMIAQNLKDCWEAGIFTEVNWVIGVPGETEDDVKEGIDLILKNRKYIGRLANINPLILVNGGVYWIDPDAHKIGFREPKEELYAKYPRALPADSWYSVDPYIDAQVRKERFERIVLALHEAGFPVGAWANRIIDDVHLERDPNRAAIGKTISDPGVSSQLEEVTAGSSQPGRDLERKSKYPASIPTLVKKEDDATEHRPAATPPLYGVAGEPPRVVRKLKTHNLVLYNGWYYGIPHALKNVSLADSDPSTLPGLIKHTSEEGVIAAIEEASMWANSRGQYDSQEQQRASESYIRAGSALGETKLPDMPDNAKIFHFTNGAFLAIDRDAVQKAFESTPLRWFDWSQRSADIVDARSPLRRLATKLPPALRYKIKHMIREQSLKEQNVTGGLIMKTDKHLLGMLLRGSMDAYLKRPFIRVLTRDPSGRAWQAAKGVHVDGEEFSIVRVATKDGLPELMWSMDGYNVVKYDGMFYGLPHGVPIDWENDDIDSISGVYHGKTVKEVVGMIESRMQTGAGKQASQATASQATRPAGEATHVPVLLGSLEGYNVVTYEGWVYGIPQTLGSLDLTEVDAIEMPGVIRDVSRDVVENEIIDQVKFKSQIAS